MSGSSKSRASDNSGMIIKRAGRRISRDAADDSALTFDEARLVIGRGLNRYSAAPARDGARVRGYAYVEAYGPVDVEITRDLPDIVSGFGLGDLMAGQKVTLWYKQFKEFMSRAARPEDFMRKLIGGELLWADGGWNLVVDLGLSEYLQVAIGGISAAAAWHAAPTNATPVPAAGDTMAVHAGWVENQDYTEAARQVWTPGAEASQSIDNSAAPSTYSINASATLGGTFMTDSVTKGGTAGTLFSAVAFTGGNRAVVNLDSVEITYTHTMADDGV